MCNGPGRRKGWVLFIFSGEQQGQTRAGSFSESKQPVEEADSEMLPRSTSNKHRVCPRARARLGALCVSSDCTRTDVRTRCAPLAVTRAGIRLHAQKCFHGQHLWEASRSISEPKDLQGWFGLGKGHGDALESPGQAQPIHSAHFQAVNAGAAEGWRCPAKILLWHVTDASADGPLGSATRYFTSLRSLLATARTCTGTGPSRRVSIAANSSGTLSWQSCPLESPRGLCWALQGPLQGPNYPPEWPGALSGLCWGPLEAPAALRRSPILTNLRV